MIIKSCDCSVAPPSCMYTQKLRGKESKKETPVEAPALPISCCKREKKWVRGEASFSMKSMSAPLHFDPSHTQPTIQTEGRHHQNSSSVASAHSPRFGRFFWRQLVSRMGAKSGVGRGGAKIADTLMLVRDDWKTETRHLLCSIPAVFF